MNLSFMTPYLAAVIVDDVAERDARNHTETWSIEGTDLRWWLDVYVDDDMDEAVLVRVTDGGFCTEREAFLFAATDIKDSKWVYGYGDHWQRQRDARVDFIHWLNLNRPRRSA